MVCTVSDAIGLLEVDYEVHGRATLNHLRWRRHHLDDAIGDLTPDALSPARINEYKLARRRKGARPATINIELNWLRRALVLAAAEGWIQAAPRIQLFRIGNRNARQDFIEPADFERLLRELERSPPVHDLVEYLYLSGWRSGEAKALTWDAVSEERIELAAADLKEGKLGGAAGRVLLLSTRLATVIERRKVARDPRTELVFHRNARPIGDFRKSWRSALRRAGLDPTIVPHSMRRSFCRNAIESGVDRDVVMRLSGHRTDCVFSRYNIIDQRRLREAALKIEAYLRRQAR